ncbi:MAG: 50S ribosomal protein L6 [Epsilonproteobacteria bacterium]|nr:50S ribosomal protein L6 [Campylobacterota bacterium]NPA57544.1 50S ribosomal protein L6 [Campylobacterota bacterium]
MSRIGKQPVVIPSGVEVKVEDGKLIAKKGNISNEVEFGDRVKVKIEDGKIIFEPVGEDKQSRAYWGTYRALTQNAIDGVTKGFEKKLEINGIGYRAAIKGKELELLLGFSHPILYPIPDGIQITVEKNIITIKGHDKQKVGQVAAEIRSFRPPEPYKKKGVKYVDEVIIQKAGKAAKK